MNKEVKQLLRTIDHIPGVELRDTGKGHIAVYKDNQFIASVSQTPSDPRWHANTLAALRRGGITPSTRPQQPAVTPTPLVSLDEIRARVRALPNRAEFARFCVEDMPKLQPGLRTYKNLDSAESSLHALTTKQEGLLEWTHLLLDQAFRTWDKLQAKYAAAAASKVEPTPEPTKAEPKRRMTKAESGRLGGHARWAKAREREAAAATSTEPVASELLDEVEEVLTAVAEHEATNANGLRHDYAEALLAVLKEEGSTVDDKILDRLDKLAGV